MTSSGTQITDMTLTGSLPAGSMVPIAVEDVATGLNPNVSYRYDLGTDLANLNSVTGISPEAYGAVGDGVTDDAAAIQSAINAAALLKCPLVFTGGKIYAVGSVGWVGLYLVSGHIDVYGNGSTLKVLVRPSQNIFVGGDRSLVRLTTCSGQRWRDLKINLNNFDLSAIVSNGGSDIEVSGCECYGSTGGTSRVFFWAMTGTGLRASGNYCHGIDFAFKTGHTTSGYEFNQVRLVANRAESLNADFHACVGTDIRCAFNDINGCYAGWALTGDDASATTCSDVVICFNTIRGFIGQGVQVDITRTGATDVRMTGINVQNNCFSSSTATAYCAYIYGTDVFDVSGNWTDTGIQRFVSIFDSTSGEVHDNILSSVAVIGASLDPTQGAGDIVNVAVYDNKWVLGAAAEGVSVQTSTPHKADGVRLNDNRITGGSTGLVVFGTGHANLEIWNNTITGQSNYSARCDTQDADILNNIYDSDGSANFGAWTMPAPSTGVVNMIGRRVFKAAYVGATAASSFTNTVVGKQFQIWATNGNLTINNGTIILKGAVNVTLASGNIINFVKMPDLTVYEVSRNF
jgi:hypothetical protein